ncbi:MAG: hypothetical protein OJF49_000653 [Ktedonobacterales bacterium]|jgi:hypothetical protein|nr:MAG: hypothetical protein OJF49_000653 [Ktedonobacterales bacterium]
MAEWLSILDAPEYIWELRAPPATEAQIAEFEAFCGRPLPDDYIAFLRTSNGGALWYKDIWFMQFWPIQDIPAICSGYGFIQSEIPDAIAFGADAGSEGLVFDMRSEHADGQYPIFAVNYVSISWRKAIPVSPDFRSLLLLRHELLWSQQ